MILRDVSKVSRQRRMMCLTAAAALVCAAAAWMAIWTGVGWVRSALVTDVPRADARDAALEDARQAGLNLASMNPDDVPGTVRLMESSMTGGLLDYMVAHNDELQGRAKQADTRIDVKVLQAALTDLNSARDHAGAIIALQQTQTPRDGRPANVQKVTWSLEMVKTSQGWKAAAANALGRPVIVDGPASAAPQPGSTPDRKPGA